MRAAVVIAGVAALASAGILAWPHADDDGGAPPSAKAPTSPPHAISVGADSGSPYQMIKFAPQGAADLPLPAAPPPPPAPPALVGVTMGARPIAYVTAAGQSWRAGVGEKVAGWRVAAIGKSSVRLIGRGRPVTLSLFGPRPAPPPPVLQTAASPAAEAAPSSTASASAAQAPARPVHLPPPPANAPKYWVGPPGSAPPGFTPMPASALPPPPMRR